MKDAFVRGINAIVIERYQNRSNETLRKTRFFLKVAKQKRYKFIYFILFLHIYSHDYN